MPQIFLIMYGIATHFACYRSIDRSIDWRSIFPIPPPIPDLHTFYMLSIERSIYRFLSLSQGSVTRLDEIMAKAIAASKGGYKLLVMITGLPWPSSAHTLALAHHLNSVGIPSSYDR